MVVKELSQYTHYRNGKKYTVLTIALPYNSPEVNGTFGRSVAFHTELEKEIEIFNIGFAVFSKENEFLVLYQQEGNSTIFARPVDMFFEHVDGNTKRFQEIEEDK